MPEFPEIQSKKMTVILSKKQKVMDEVDDFRLKTKQIYTHTSMHIL